MSLPTFRLELFLLDNRNLHLITGLMEPLGMVAFSSRLLHMFFLSKPSPTSSVNLLSSIAQHHPLFFGLTGRFMLCFTVCGMNAC